MSYHICYNWNWKLFANVIQATLLQLVWCPSLKGFLSEDCHMSLVFDQPAFRKHSEGKNRKKIKQTARYFATSASPRKNILAKQMEFFSFRVFSTLSKWLWKSHNAWDSGSTVICLTNYIMKCMSFFSRHIKAQFARFFLIGGLTFISECFVALGKLSNGKPCVWCWWDRRRRKGSLSILLSPNNKY